VKLLVDTDVLIDVALKREPFAEPAGRFLDEMEVLSGAAFMAWHSAANFNYLVSSPLGGPTAREFIRDLLRFVKVAPVGTEDLSYALGLNMPDFEDAMQAAAAIACRADFIVTRNEAHYRRSPVKALTPDAWLRKYGREGRSSAT
jgi:predicted nucleic acid-binding protein